MELDFSAEQKKFRDELRIYFEDMMDDALVAELRTEGEGGGIRRTGPNTDGAVHFRR